MEINKFKIGDKVVTNGSIPKGIFEEAGLDVYKIYTIIKIEKENQEINYKKNSRSGRKLKGMLYEYQMILFEGMKDTFNSRYFKYDNKWLRQQKINKIWNSI